MHKSHSKQWYILCTTCYKIDRSLNLLLKIDRFFGTQKARFSAQYGAKNFKTCYRKMI